MLRLFLWTWWLGPSSSDPEICEVLQPLHFQTGHCLFADARLLGVFRASDVPPLAATLKLHFPGAASKRTVNNPGTPEIQPKPLDSHAASVPSQPGPCQRRGPTLTRPQTQLNLRITRLSSPCPTLPWPLHVAARFHANFALSLMLDLMHRVRRVWADPDHAPYRAAQLCLQAKQSRCLRHQDATIPTVPSHMTLRGHGLARREHTVRLAPAQGRLHGHDLKVNLMMAEGLKIPFVGQNRIFGTPPRDPEPEPFCKGVLQGKSIP